MARAKYMIDLPEELIGDHTSAGEIVSEGIKKAFDYKIPVITCRFKNIIALGFRHRGIEHVKDVMNGAYSAVI